MTAERSFSLGFGPDGHGIEGVLSDDDLSLTYDAARREVRAHPSGELLGDDVFAVLDDLLDGDPDTLWVGWLGYACRPDLPARPADGVPDAVWMRPRERRAPLGRVPRRRVLEPPQHSTPPPWYREAFDEVQRQLRAGNSYEVNLTCRVEAGTTVGATELHRRLTETNPAPYAGQISHLGSHLVSSSPERFARIDRGRCLEARPIKGTTPRGLTPEEDNELRDRLVTDPKLRAENLMITDLLRNDLSIVCTPGTVEVPGLMEVESYASVHQLVSTIRGRLRDDVTAPAALRALFPAGSMTGAPKLRTMEIIDAVEATPRGVYAGAFGWISGDGRVDLGVVIRSLVGDPSGRWTIGTGGGITVRSDPAEEWDETRWKLAPLLAALA